MRVGPLVRHSTFKILDGNDSTNQLQTAARGEVHTDIRGDLQGLSPGFKFTGEVGVKPTLVVSIKSTPGVDVRHTPTAWFMLVVLIVGANFTVVAGISVGVANDRTEVETEREHMYISYQW